MSIVRESVHCSVLRNHFVLSCANIQNGQEQTLETKIGKRQSLRTIENLLHRKVEFAVSHTLNLLDGDDPAGPIPADNFPHSGAINCAVWIRIVPYEFHN
jgi:hypothetical protein